MSMFRCPFCDSSEILEYYDGQALKCNNCEEIGTPEEFTPKSKKEKIKRVKHFDDEIPDNQDNVENP